MQLITLSGYQRAGKTLTAQLLQQLTGWPILSTSDYLIEICAMNTGRSILEIQQMKHVYREKLIDLGMRIEAQEPARLVKHLLIEHLQKEPNTEGIILDSVRRASEVQYLKQAYPKTIFLLLEAERTTRASRGELACEDDPTELEAVSALQNLGEAVVIPNNDSYEALQDAVDDIVAKYIIQEPLGLYVEKH